MERNQHGQCEHEDVGTQVQPASVRISSLKDERQQSVNVFVANEKDILDDFKYWWQKKNRENPAEYPATLTVGEWEEQFRSWVNCGCGQHDDEM